MPKSSRLAGKLLLSMPVMSDPRFYRSVIFMCSHDDEGSMGLIINHSFLEMTLGQMLDQMSLEASSATPSDIPVLTGGPVETGRGFLLHTSDFQQPETLQVSPGLGVTGTIEALEAVAMGKGPRDMLFMLGYTGWSAGQLDHELQENTWLIADADPELIFNTPLEDKWSRAMGRIGIDPGMLSTSAGRA